MYLNYIEISLTFFQFLSGIMMEWYAEHNTYVSIFVVLSRRLQQSGLDMYGHRDSIEVAELYSHAMDYYYSYPRCKDLAAYSCCMGRYSEYIDSDSCGLANLIAERLLQNLRMSRSYSL